MANALRKKLLQLLTMVRQLPLWLLQLRLNTVAKNKSQAMRSVKGRRSPFYKEKPKAKVQENAEIK